MTTPQLGVIKEDPCQSGTTQLGIEKLRECAPAWVIENGVRISGEGWAGVLDTIVGHLTQAWGTCGESSWYYRDREGDARFDLWLNRPRDGEPDLSEECGTDVCETLEQEIEQVARLIGNLLVTPPQRRVRVTNWAGDGEFEGIDSQFSFRGMVDLRSRC